MSKKANVIMITAGAILFVSGIVWDILSAVGVITNNYNTTPLFMFGLFWCFLGAHNASKASAKGKEDSDKK